MTILCSAGLNFTVVSLQTPFLHEMYVGLDFPTQAIIRALLRVIHLVVNRKFPKLNKIHICDRDCKTLLLAPLVYYDKESDM
jgi:hypothetical protein